MADTPYTRDFFTRLEVGARRSAQRVVPLVLEYLKPASVIDVGCGLGAWLSAFGEHGVTDLWGVDGAHVREIDPTETEFRFTAHDLTRPLHVARHFDLAVSLEVAEHLPPECARSFVESLTRLGPVTLFSAAIPGQGGTDHRNEQWPDYWADHFTSMGYIAVDVLRSRLWGDPEVEWWYAQNAVFYVAEAQLAAYPRLSSNRACGAGPLRLVHPALLERTVWLHRAAAAARDLCTLVATLPRGAERPEHRSNAGTLPGIVLVDDYATGDEFLPLGATRLLERDGRFQAVPATLDPMIAALDAARAGGAEVLVVAWPSFWWLDHVAGLRAHLAASCPLLLQSSDLLAFDLRPSGSIAARKAATSNRGAD